MRNVRRGIPPQPRGRVAAGTISRDGAALADRLLRVRRQLVAGSAPQRRHPAGRQQLRKLGRAASAATADMVDKWHTLGFVVEQGAEHVEVERCDTAIDHAAHTACNFIDVPQGPMGMVREAAARHHLRGHLAQRAPSRSNTRRAARPRIRSSSPTTRSVTVGPTAAAASPRARLWIIYQTGAAPAAIPTQTVTVQRRR